MNRKQQLQLIWRHTHADYRGVIHGVPSILVLRKGGTQAVMLDDLTDQEIESNLRYAVSAEERRLKRLVNHRKSEETAP